MRSLGIPVFSTLVCLTQYKYSYHLMLDRLARIWQDIKTLKGDCVNLNNI